MAVPNIPGLTRLEECPKTVGCVAKVVWKDAESNLWRLDVSHGGDFVPHICRVRGSEMPTIAYLAKWHNKNTRRTRWIGPERLERSVKRRPTDQRAKPEDWVLKKTLFAKLEWQDLEVFEDDE